MTQVFPFQSGKRQVDLVAGLSWHTVEPKKLREELKKFTGLGLDLYVARKNNQAVAGEKTLVGFGKIEEGAEAGQIPIALVIAESLAQESPTINAAVAVALPGNTDTYLFILIREGYILAGTDVVGTENAIQSQLFEAMSGASWDAIICPTHWRVNDSTPRDLESFMPRKKGQVFFSDAWKLRPTRAAMRKNALQLLAIAALLGGSWWGYNYWIAMQAQELAIRQAQQQAAMLEAQRAAALQREPWMDLPRASAFATACRDAVDRVGLVVTSWNLVDFTCTDKLLTVKWERSNPTAWVTHMKHLHPSAIISQDGIFSTVTAALTPQAAKGAKEALLASRTRTEALLDFPNKYGMQMSVKAKSPAPVPAAPGVDAMPWTELEIAATTTLGLTSAVGILDAPGFRLNKIVGTYKGGVIKYQLNGVQYAKP